MRIRKGRGKAKDRVSLTENEIVQACHDFLESKGYQLSNVSYLKVPTKDAVDSLGRKKRRGIEFQVDIEGHEEPER
jgi:hypothetical protein